MTEHKYRRWAAAAFAFIVVLSSALRAQTVGASLQGTIYDPSGAVVPNARIEIRNTETGAARILTSDKQGRYREPVLGPGEYEVRVSASGFQAIQRRGIQLTVGQDALLDFTLELIKTSETVSVTGDATRINLASGALSGLVDQKQLRDLPLNGRSFQQLALLQPGVGAALAAGNDVVGGRTPKISINGARPEQSSFLLDGTDINNVYNKTPGSVAGVLLGVEAVLEFQVLTNAYSAEFGRSSGGIINAVTRSGTNQFHGSAFEFLRNSALDARNFFDPPTAPIPPFKRNQFGGSAGGPIHRDKTFFFGAFESLSERLGVSGVASVPDLNARQGILPGRPPVQLHPLIPQYLDTLFPMPNGRSLGGGIAEFLFSRSQPTDEYFAQGRIDHRFSARDALFGRYTFDNGNVNRQVINKPPISFTKERSRNQYVTLEHQHIFTSAMVNTLRLGFARSTQEADNQRTISIPPQLSWVPGEKFGYFTIQGMVTEMAGDFRLPRNDHLNNYQWHDTLFWTKGAQGLRFGLEGQRLQFNQNTSSQVGGIVTFAGLEDFLKGVPSNVDLALPGKLDPIRGYRQWLFAFYAQDDVRWRPNFTVNLGLRYEFVTTPTEVNGKISNLRTVYDPALTIGDPWHSNPSLKNFAPRVGLAWDPFKDGKTSVRAGFGMFYDEILPKSYFFSGSLNPPFTTRTTIPKPPFPNVLQGFDLNAPVKAQLQPINFDLQPAYIVQFNFSVQRSLPGDWDLTLGYAGSRGFHLFRIGDANLRQRSLLTASNSTARTCLR
jgi:outer membrane receptor protein involved in Fe transport